MIRRAVAVGAVAVATTACSPTDWVYVRYFTGNTNNQVVSAKAGANDGAGSRFRVEVICGSEPFWRAGNTVDVNGAPNGHDADGTPNGRFESKVQCPSPDGSTRQPITAMNVRRL